MTEVTDLRLDRFSGGLAGSVVLATAGLLQGSATLLVAAAIPVAYVAYGALSGVSLDPAALSARRKIDRSTVFPGDRVAVTVELRNEGDRAVADLRVVDGVPDAVSVVEGRPRTAVSLRPGESTTLEYTVVARRGDHEFGPVRCRARSPSATDVVTVDLSPEGERSLSCRPDVEGVPLARQTRQYAGEIGTDEGGSGVEFHSTREYRRGDPVNRIDWRRLAKGGDLTTVDYREQRTAQVLVLVDAREPCYVAPVRGAPTAAAMCGYGARRVYDVLRSEGHSVGAAALGIPDRFGTGGPAWVDPGGDEETRVRARELFEAATRTPEYLRTDESTTGRERSDDAAPQVSGNDPGGTAPAAADGGRTGSSRATGDQYRRDRRRNARSGSTDPVDVVCSRIPPSAQVLFFTPALDRFPETVVEQLVAYGHEVTVVSPDVTHEGTRGARIRSVERDLLLEDLRSTGTRVVDWQRDRSLALTLSSVLEGI